ncbi:MAG: magnesium transporter [Gammaproteobacteria bacterium]
MSYTDNGNRNLELVRAVRTALEANELGQIREQIAALHPAELADLLESLPTSMRDELWIHIEPQNEGDVLVHVSDPVRSGILEGMHPHEVAAATETLETDDAADILQDLSEDIVGEVLRSMDSQNRQRISAVLHYPEDSAGGLMNVDTVAVRADVDVDVVLRYLRRLGDNVPQRTDSLIVVDRENTYLGLLPLATLLTAAPETVIGELMFMDADPIRAQTTANDVVTIFEQRDLLSAAVVDDDGHLLGRITIDDVVDVMRVQNAHSVMSAAGLDENDDLFAPVLGAAKRRATWLAVNLGTAFLAAWVIGLFEATIDQIVALAVLMPIVASMGGVAGMQTLTIVIRGMALGQIGRANARLIITREISIALLNCLLWASVVAVLAGFWFKDLDLGLVIGAALIINLMVAAVSGVVIPIILRRLNIDPALAGAVALTTVTDVMGFFAFLGLAAVVLL